MKTAVEWLVEMLNSKYGNDDFIITHINEIEQAKEMEKQQKMDAWNDGNCNTDLKGNPSANYAISAEHYCNQKYGNETTQKLE